MDLMQRRRAAMAAQPRLPWGYQAVEWIRFAKGTYTSAALILPDIQYSADFELDGYSYQGDSMVALGNAPNKRTYSLERISASSPYWSLWVSIRETQSRFSVGSRRIISYRQSVFSVDNVEIGRVANPKSQGEFCIGNNFYNEKAPTSWPLVLYNLKLYDPADDKLVRNLIPCYRKSDSAPGLYDIVNNVFYTNRLTGNIIIGPIVN